MLKPCTYNQLREVVIPIGKSQLSGLIGQPRNPKRTGLCGVVLVHGFAAEKTENGFFDFIAETLLKEGHTVLLYDWRGLGDSKGDFAETDLELHTSDFQEVATWFAKYTGILPQNTCALGFSLGATLVALSVNKGGMFGGLALLSPALRPAVSMWPRYNTLEVRKELKTQGYVLKNEVRVGRRMLNSLQETDLGNNSLGLNIPILVCHGTADTRIPITTTREAYGRLKSGAVYFAEFQDASHSFRPEPNYWERLAVVLTKWLGDAELRRTKKMTSIPLDAPKQDQPRTQIAPAGKSRSRVVSETRATVAA